ncbi:thiamine diphosphokinase [Eggerthellaceae bacterium zg-997]|nr:thiamine diphosphokinase [Eggerthellaceae bacterium zg-997]
MSICALVAASEFNAEHFSCAYKTGAFDEVIAVDAGFAHLEALGIAPDLALGDFDSLGYVPSCRRVSQHAPEKDKSDLELALERALMRRYDEAHVYGALGGRLDHTVANLQLFARFSEQGMRVTAFDHGSAVCALSGPDVLDLPALDFGTVSVFSMSDEAQGVFERGMKYALDDEPLSNRTSRGLSNELTGQPALVGVESGTLLVFHPLV